ncbi:hypothetical protein [Legionella nagasakiensis]|uniref:hypothetical protein n=1 Tax=Legionella nagasakiensis TaxID=535290 RepID=UPI001056533A|nr:hypothetical protein [Legionella nagasakiensis]
MKTIMTLCTMLILLIPNIGQAKASQTPSNPKPCSLEQLKTNETLKRYLNFSKDPAGLSVESKENDTNVPHLFQQYASQHQCAVYTISMMELVKGLLKGSTSNLFNNDPPSDVQSEQNNIRKKFIVIDGDKAVCIKKLGLQLPLMEFLPKHSKTHQNR